jgi:hypothetical protein
VLINKEAYKTFGTMLSSEKVVETIRKEQLEFDTIRKHAMNQYSRLGRELKSLKESNLKRKIRLIRAAHNQTQIYDLRHKAIQKERLHQCEVIERFRSIEREKAIKHKEQAKKLTDDNLAYIVNHNNNNRMLINVKNMNILL